jgi:5-methylcytosine-specific restriction endonuclease McrA
MRAVSEGQWSLRATIDRACKDDLETLSMLLSHKVPRGDLAAVLHEAIRCGIEKHGKRKGAVKPGRKVAPKAAPSKDPAAIPAEVRRQVWERDGGRCAWTGPDGKRCGSRWQLEVDHVDPVARGGTSALGAVRVLCRMHNLLYAEQVYGREFMQKYRKGESTIDGGSGGAGRARREVHIAG